MWKRVAVLVVVALLPVSAVARAKLFYRMSCKSDYRKVEVMVDTPEPTVTLESTLAPEPTLTPIPTEIQTPTPSVEIMDTEDPEETSDQITTPSDVDDQVDIASL